MADEEIVSASAILAPDDPDWASGEVDHVAGAGVGVLYGDSSIENRMGFVGGDAREGA